VPACATLGVGLLPWSPLGGGLLGGVLQKLAGGRRVASERIRRLVETRRPQLERWETYCAELGHPPADVALAWLLRQPAVTAPIVGPRTLAQLRDSARALGVTLDDAACARLDEIWPGPGGAAPEAYAW
jgi:aryl-alcohol dehydrogenase-like predicted oxidoreductase